MRDARVVFALILLGLLLVFSFNAYACVLPIDGGAHQAAGHDCEVPGKEPVRQVCDLFKVFSLHAWIEPEPTAVAYDLHAVVSNLWSVMLVADSRPLLYPLEPVLLPAQESPLLIPVLLL